MHKLLEVMHKFIAFLLVLALLHSCNTDNDKKATTDSLNNRQNDFAKEQAAATDSLLPPVANLPFGPKIRNIKQFYSGKYDDSFYNEFVRDHEQNIRKYETLFKLPIIDSFQYLELDEDRATLCNNETTVNKLIEIKKCKMRLPDVKGFQVYYMSDDRYDSSIFSNNFLKSCPNDRYQKYGYLVLYNPENRIAKLTLVFIENYVDALTTRHFYIDKGYNIHVNQYTTTDGDNGGAETWTDWIIKINLPGGKVVKVK